MIFSSMTVNNTVLESAMQAAALRNEVINNNLANAETPGFKKKTVLFEESLRKALDAVPDIRNADLSRVRALVRLEHSRYSYRVDENNVDIEQEMVALYQNSIKYDTLADGVANNYKRINLVLNAK